MYQEINYNVDVVATFWYETLKNKNTKATQNRVY